MWVARFVEIIARVLRNRVLCAKVNSRGKGAEQYNLNEGQVSSHGVIMEVGRVQQ